MKGYNFKKRFSGILYYSIIVIALLCYPFFAKAGFFGVGFYLSSEPADDRNAMADAMSDLGISITRQGFTYNSSPDFTGSDDAVDKTLNRGVEILGLLGYESSLPSVEEWTIFVDEVVSRYNGKINAWEIFNEQDSISGSEYKPYLEASYNKIKSINGDAKVIVGGLTARSEAISFWDSLYGAGGWDYFDALGLHPYRDDPPETVRYNIGDFVTSINLAANTIRNYGGGKTIWLTEFGVKSTTVGDTNQANYIARSYIMARSVPEVEKVIMYRYRDGDGWGMVRSDLSAKPLYDLYKNIIQPLDFSGTAERIYAYDRRSIDSFDSISDWNTEATSNGSLNLAGDSGYSGGGMKFEYNFNTSDAYAVAEKAVSLEGSPVGIGIWAKGSTSNGVLKLRVKDSQDETFQFDLGKVGSDWTFFKFDFNLDSAKTSWGGNGSIDYPIQFDSIVYDRQGGAQSGTLYFDELVAIHGAADLYAYKLGSKLAYWRVSGTETSSACGQTLTFEETPQITDVSDCDGWSGVASSPLVDSPNQEEPAQQEVNLISKEKSQITLDKDKATADGIDKINIRVVLKSDSEEVLSSSQLNMEVSGKNSTVTGPERQGDDYVFTLVSTKAEEKTIKITVGAWELGSTKATFLAGALSLSKTRLQASKTLLLEKDNLSVAIAGKDKYGNNVALASWKVIANGRGFSITQPSKSNKNKAKIKFNDSGRFTIYAQIGKEKIKFPLIVYVNPKLTEFKDLASEQVTSLNLKETGTFEIVGKQNEIRGLKITNATGANLIIKIESDPTYFWLAKTASGTFSNSFRLPSALGEHKVTLYSENADGKQKILKQGTLLVEKNLKYTYIIVAVSVASLIILGFIIYLWIREPLWLKTVLAKTRKDKSHVSMIEKLDKK